MGSNGFVKLIPTAIPRLVQLCREPKERNYSDAVLVACLVSNEESDNNPESDINRSNRSSSSRTSSSIVV